MRLRLRWAALALALVCTGVRAAEEKDAKGDAEKGETKEYKLRTLRLNAPESWKYIEPTNQFRVGSFEIPAVEGDEDPSELIITTFAGGGGGVKANVDRWVGQFDAKDREVKVSTGEAKQGVYVFVDITGTYNMPVGPPIRMQTKKVENARLLAVILSVGGKDNYFLKLGGPRATVTANADAFRASFGGKAEDEKEVDVKDMREE